MGVPRNAKDIIAKHLTGAFPEDALSVFGIPGLHVVRALPTELDTVDIRQGLMDIVLELRDAQLLHMEFQSSKEPSLDRFLVYDAHLYAQFHQTIRTIVLYIGDVGHGPEEVNAGAIRYRVENVYLREFDGDAVLDTIERHLAEGDWDVQDRIRLAFALHMNFERLTREQAFDKVVEITRKIPDRLEQNYVTALILGLSGRELSDKQEEQLKEVLRMTDVVREIEHEAEERGVRRGRQEGEFMKAIEVAKNLIRLGDSVEKAARATGLSVEDIQKLVQ